MCRTYLVQILGRSVLLCCKITFMQSSMGGYCFVQKIFVYFMGEKIYQLKFTRPFYEERFCNKCFYCLQVKSQLKCSTWGNSAWSSSETTWAVCVAGTGAVELLNSEGSKMGVALWCMGTLFFPTSYISDHQFRPFLCENVYFFQVVTCTGVTSIGTAVGS